MSKRDPDEVGPELQLLFGFFLFPAPHSHRRGGARGRSKSRDRFFQNSLELVPPVSPPESGPPSPDVTSCKDSLEDVSADVTEKFKFLGTHDCAQLSAGSSKTPVGQMGASLKFSENGDPNGFFSRNPFDSSPSQAAGGFRLDVTQTREAMAVKTSKPSGHHVDVKGKSGAQDVQKVPFLGSYAGGVTLEEILGDRGTVNGLGEVTLPSSRQKSPANPQDPHAAGRIADSGQDMAFLGGKYGGNTPWPIKSTHNVPNSSSQILNETPNNSESNTTGFGVKAAVTGRKEAVCSGVQGLRNQIPAMPEEITAPAQTSRLPLSPPLSSSHRVEIPGKNSAHGLSEPSRMTSDC